MSSGTAPSAPGGADDARSASRRELLALLRPQQAPASADGQAAVTAAGGATAGAARLTAAQRRMWLLQQSDPDGSAYNTVRAVELRGPLDTDALRAAWTRVLERHAVLRSHVVGRDGVPETREVARPDVVWSEARVGDLDAATADAFAAGAVAFDLARELPLRVRLLRLAADHHVMVVTVHHIVSDEGSRTALWRELAAAYRHELDPAVALPPLPPPYAAFAAWQQDHLRSRRADELRFWRRRLRGAPQTLTLPPDRIRPPRPSTRGARRRLPLDAGSVERLRGCAREQNATVFMVALATYLWLLRSWTDESDVVVGMPVTARGTSGRFDGTVGLFVNTVALRVDCSGTPTFAQLVGGVRSAVLEVLDHQDLPFDEVVDAVCDSRDQARTPLVQMLVNGVRIDDDGLRDLPGIVATPLDVDPGTTKFDSGVVFVERGETLEVVVGWSTDLYREETVELLLEQFAALLHHVVDHPDEPLSTDPMLSARQRRLLADLNDTATDVPGGTVTDAIAAQVERTPERPAVGDDTVGWLTYREAWDRAGRVAQRLRAHGVGVGSRVAVLVERSVAMEIAVLGVLRAGAAYVPLDIGSPPERLGSTLADAGVRAVVVDRTHLADVPVHPRVVALEPDGEPAGPAGPVDLGGPAAGPGDPLYVIYTSGSTGTPKGVVVPHRGVVNRLAWMQETFPIGPGSTLLQKTPLGFDVSGWEVLWPLMTGARLFLAAPGGHRDPAYLAATIAAQEVSVVHFVPSMLEVFLDVVTPGQLPALRTVVVSGEALPASTRDRFGERLGAVGLANLYGPTEASIDVTHAPQRPGSGDVVTIGRPISNTEVHVLDDDLRPRPVGVPGELFLGGVGLATGYLDRPELTAQRFLAVPWARGGRLYRTGDRARITATGEVEYLGRTDDQVKLRGFRIELGEVEAVLARQPGVRRTAAGVVPHPGGGPALVAWVVPDTTDGTDAADAPVEPGGGPVGAAADALASWAAVWERTYDDDVGDDRPDYSGWSSSYTGAPIPVVEMERWVDDTLALLRSTHPRRVLEIGAGSGLLMARLAPEVECYVATDLAAPAVARLRRIARRHGWDHVEAAVAPADAVAEALADRAPFDLVVLNSVVQYFPDAAYLDEVLAGAVRLTARPGTVVVGDVRNLVSLAAFDLEAALARAEPGATLSMVAAHARRRAEQETELVVHPAAFSDLAGREPAISSVDVRAKRGRDHTEMNAFRYDVVLGVGQPPAAAPEPAPPTVVPWTALGSLDRLRVRLVTGTGRLLCTGVPDARSTVSAHALAAIAAGDTATTVREIVADAPAGVEIDDLAAVAAAAGHTATPRPAGPGTVDVLFAPHGDTRPGVEATPVPVAEGEPLTNAPATLAADRARRGLLVGALDAAMRARLPEHMVPQAVVVVPELPVTGNGKLDRRALPMPEFVGATGPRRAPATDTERLVAATFCEVLGVAEVGADDDLFALGGHSLTAARLAALLERRAGHEVGLGTVFDHPTVAGIAAVLDAAGARAADDPGPRTRSGAVVGRSLTSAPLSAAQERMLFLTDLAGSTALYGLRRVYRLRGELSPVALRRAAEAVGHRHPALRVVVERAAAGPQQVVTPWPVPVVEHDVRGADDPAIAAAAIVRGLARDGFDLATGPLFRVVVIRLAERDWQLVLHCHHLVADGWSLDLVARELAATHDAVVAGREPAAEPAPPSYLDVVADPRAGVHSAERTRQLEYWRERLAGAPASLELPLDRPRPAVRSWAGGRVALDLDADLTRGIAALARRCAATPFSVLVAAVGLVLGGLAGGDEVVLGTPVAGRTRAEYDTTVGLFVNTVVLRVGLTGHHDVAALVNAVRQEVVGALRHQDVEFERVVEHVQPRRDPSRNPLFQVLVNLQPAGGELPTVGGVALEPVDTDTDTARFDLSFSFREQGETLALALDHSTDLFDHASVRRLADRVAAVLRQVVADPGLAPAALDLVLPDEAALLDTVAVGPPTPADLPLTLAAVRAVAARDPDRPAVVDADGAWSYGELLAVVDRTAARLAAVAGPRRTLVGICLRRRRELVAAALAVWATGAAYVPMDPEYPTERLRFMVEDARLDLVLGDPGDTPDLGGAVTVVPVAAGGGADPSPVAGPPAGPAGPGDTAYVIYTSGSTGRPKGVEVGHRALSTLLHSMAAEPGLRPGERLLAVTTFSFDIAALELFGPLVVGATVVLAAEDDARDPARLQRWMEAAAVDVLQATPSTWRMLLAAGWPGRAGLRAWCGGEPLTPDLAAALTARVGALWNLYGPTETTIWSTAARVDHGPVTVGRPVAGTVVAVRDELGRRVPPGSVGEIVIGGAGVAEGYWHRPELTASKFVTGAAGREFRTGDLGRWRRDGRLEVLGRRDHQVKLRGHRIELGEIEAALAAHPAVAEATVVVDESAPGGPRLVGYIVAAATDETAAPTAGEVGAAGREFELLTELRLRLPAVMVPAVLVELAAMPRTANGKTDRAALPAPSRRVRARREPGTATERLVAATWTELLGVDDVGADDDFFALGGHSLLAVTLVAKLGAATGRDVALRVVFEAPTVAGLAAAIDQLPSIAARVSVDRAGHRLAVARLDDPEAVLAARDGRADGAPRWSGDDVVEVLPLSAAQTRMWLLQAISPTSAAYTVSALRRLDGPLDTGRLRGALDALVERHEVLRTTYRRYGAQVVALVAPARPVVFDRIDGTDRPAHEVDDLLRGAVTVPVDLEHGPILRASLVRTAPGTAHLALSVHHIAVDAASLTVLLDDLAAGYDAPGAARPAATAYGDLVLSGAIEPDPAGRAADEAFWEQTLRGVPATTALPTDHRPPAVETAAGGRVRLRLSPDHDAALDALARRLATTPYAVVLAAVAVLLQRHGAGDDIVLGMPLTGRDTPGSERVVGPLLNTVPVRVDLTGGPTFAQLVERVAAASASAVAHGRLPFEQLLALAGSGHEHGRQPLFSVVVSGRGAPPASWRLGATEGHPVDLDRRLAMYDLTVVADLAPGIRALAVEYRAELFEPDTAHALLQRLVVLLADATARPDTPVAALSLITPVDRDLLRARETSQALPARLPSLPAAVRTVAAGDPQALAVRSGDREISFGQLVLAADALGARLRAAGVAAGDIVGLAVGRHVEWPVAVFGVWAVGAAYLALDPSYPAERTRAAVAEAGCRILLATARDPHVELPAGVRRVEIDLDDLLAGPADPTPAPDPAPDALAYVVYTSGSTGTPKGSLVDHANLAAFTAALPQVLPGGPRARRHALNAPLAFDASVQQLVHLATGSSLDLLPDDIRRDPAAAVAYVRAHDVEVFDCTPTHLRVLAAAGLLERGGPRVLLVGGEAVEQDLWDVLRAADVTALNCYGPTEVTVQATVAAVDDSPLPVLGRPLPGIRVRVVDAGGAPVPPGAPGELWLGGPQTTRGYLARPELSAQRFVAAPAGTGTAGGPGRWYRTGDRARWDRAGRLVYLGRDDDQVKIRGHRIELGEIEAAFGALPAVAAAAATVFEHADGRDLVVHVVPADRGASPDPAALRSGVRDVLPAALLPRWIVLTDQIPRLPSGKADRAALSRVDPTAGASTGPPPGVGHDPIGDDPVDQLVAGLWAEALGHDHFGATDDFFDVGGNSLLAIGVLASLRELAIELPVTAVFDRPTVAGLSERVAALLLDDSRADVS